jgi:AraC-like DNA-binding protein
MIYEEFASDILRHETIGFRSAEENEEAMQRMGIKQTVRQLKKGLFRADLAGVETKEAVVVSDRYRTACAMSLEPPAGMVSFVLFKSGGGPLLASGVNVANDTLVIFPEGSGTNIVTPDLSGSEAIGIPVARFDEISSTLFPRQEWTRPLHISAVNGDLGRLQSLRYAILDLATRQETARRTDRIADLIANLIAWTNDATGSYRPEILHGNGARHRVAKRAQEFIEEHYRQSIGLEDLCRVTGVGMRTLQRCFQEIFSITISEYLKTVRFDSARRDLAAAHPSESTVTSIALRNGLPHLGRFSVEFRARYGVAPRAILAQQKSVH